MPLPPCTSGGAGAPLIEKIRFAIHSLVERDSNPRSPSEGSVSLAVMGGGVDAEPGSFDGADEAGLLRRRHGPAATPHGLSDVTPPARPATAALKSHQALVPPVEGRIVRGEAAVRASGLGNLRRGVALRHHPVEIDDATAGAERVLIGRLCRVVQFGRPARSQVGPVAKAASAPAGPPDSSSECGCSIGEHPVLYSASAARGRSSPIL
jgi:hypothetical protein